MKENVTTQPAGETIEQARVRDWQRVIRRSLAQRSSKQMSWYKPIGVEAAESATAGLMHCADPVPKDLLRALDLPVRLTWGTLAEILRGAMPSAPAT